jgi:anti-sigma factor (TIGR02949 family)
MKHQHPGGCRHLLDSLSEFVDGELAEEICAEIEQHLTDCENCHVVVDTLRKTVSLYQTKADAPHTLPSEVRSRLYHRLDLDEFINK